MRRIIQSILLTAAALFLVGCTTRQEQAQPEDENSQAEKVVNYSELSIDELEVLGYDGDVEAQYRLGQLYEYGSEDIDQDFDLAREWYERAATAPRASWLSLTRKRACCSRVMPLASSLVARAVRARSTSWELSRFMSA